MSKTNNEINDIHADSQLALFTETNDSVEDLLYEFLKDLGAATERAYQRDLKSFFSFTGGNFGLPRLSEETMLFGESRISISGNITFKNYSVNIIVSDVKTAYGG
ncbi:MAG: hypothetical protein ACRBBP_09705 [Bdellovibrionales bacterium]